MRLNKYLAQSGVASRRKADALIVAGKVRVNGQQVTTLGVGVTADDLVELNGKAVGTVEDTVIYLIHKPTGVISAAGDPRGRKTVVDLIRDSRRLFPVGRLDRDTTGALLITNDGELTNPLTHPRFGVQKRYVADVLGRLSPEALARLDTGMTLSEGMRVRAKLRQVARRGRHTLYEIILTEGQNREVKRIFKHFGLTLLRLHRSHFAGLSADSMALGHYRRLRPKEIKALTGLAVK